ncbi:hypothetical protein R69927_04081 [Paraburkholderia domus]|jgi:hypothetical protein|uniref:Uncharacterized protein n=1 Tax=Paraburkholderia domus TaxID=2793075 RepID=A0A9N8MQW0_9BURK|nr:hypothetical protein [Paraburkholderia domus]MBK5061607.1 hypothetical protein [Burkholderia sp. R-70199]MBK5088318.1 hypothetical protein [Burkholderia sp. R-69927]MBK5123780.1 hypothetical protein [Burkholderia sp. R-69980]MBK5165417.1 hypothetical protein [Burkholderia sp. R-70211]CAE6784143.1 hypothetical protein R75483_04587 [Paraburkholderia domus]
MQTEIQVQPVAFIRRATPAVRPLPEGFESLAPFVHVWALETETERNTQRHTVGMDAILAFRDAILPQVDDVVAYLNQYALGTLDEHPEAMTMMYLLLSLAEIAPAIEFYNQPSVIDGYESSRFRADESFVMRPLP